MAGLKATPPNNLGATLLMALGLMSAPTGVGIVLFVSGLALLRQANGQPCHPRLQEWLSGFQRVQFWRMIKL